MLIQLMVQILTLGSAYALAALGFVLVLNATGAVNFAQGDLVMAGGFAAAVFGRWLGWPGLAVLPLVLAALALGGLAVAGVAYLPLRRRPAEAVFISTIAVGIILQSGATLVFGAEPLAAPSLLGGGRLRVLGAAASVQSLAIIAVAAVLAGGLHLALRYTQAGRRLRAVAHDREMAAAVGIPVTAVAMGAFGLGAALAGAAGLLLGNAFFVTPTVGGDYMLKAYMAVVVGGWGSVPGAMLGALLLALVEIGYPSLPLLLPSLPDGLFSQVAAQAVLDAVVLAVLVVRPRGLLGEAAGRRP